jgi:REP element-mobilizing transposase RayT
VETKKDQSNIPPQAAVRGAVSPRFGEVRIRDRRLPHWEKEGALYFVTFRLADSLPRQVIEKMIERHKILEAAKENGANLLPHQKALVAEFNSSKIEEYFDRGIGACHLRDPRIASLVANAIRLRHGSKYRLVAWCIMPNHVHVVFRLLPGQELSSIMNSWKSYTARMANRILGRTGAFWQREHYDHLIRNGDEFERAVRYVLQNPESAGLKNWEWVWSTGVNARTTSAL